MTDSHSKTCWTTVSYD